jgi:hypothetical protein
MLVQMRRTTTVRTPPGRAIDDDATMHQFVSALVEIALADYAADQLFGDEVLNDCLQFILSKNRGLEDFGGHPWPERRMVQAIRSHLNALRAAKRN